MMNWKGCLLCYTSFANDCLLLYIGTFTPLSYSLELKQKKNNENCSILIILLFQGNSTVSLTILYLHCITQKDISPTDMIIFTWRIHLDRSKHTLLISYNLRLFLPQMPLFELFTVVQCHCSIHSLTGNPKLWKHLIAPSVPAVTITELHAPACSVGARVQQSGWSGG